MALADYYIFIEVVLDAVHPAHIHGKVGQVGEGIISLPEAPATLGDLGCYLYGGGEEVVVCGEIEDLAVGSLYVGALDGILLHLKAERLMAEVVLDAL